MTRHSGLAPSGVDPVGELVGELVGDLGADPRHADRLREYYEDSWFDYRFLWLDPRTRAMHFGYHDGGRRSHADALLALNAVMADRVDVRAGEQVLDAGCGVGGTSFWLTETLGADVVGINLVADHIERARRYTAERALDPGPRFEVADYTDTGLASSSFDVVWATESACHAPSKAPFAEEAARVLRPGGRLVMAEYVLFPHGVGHAAVKGWEDGWEMTLATADEWTKVLRDAGFDDVRIDDVAEHVEPSLRRLRRLCALLGPVAAVLHLFGIRTAAQQRNIAGSNAMWRATREGCWFYAIMSATKRAD